MKNCPVAFPAPSGDCSRSAWQHEVGAHRGFLVRFARRRLHDHWVAEDLVHDVFEEILAGRAVFAGRSSMRTWMVAVLLHKISDYWRSRYRDVPFGKHPELTESGVDPPIWSAAPQALAEHRERLARALCAIDELPATLRAVMRLRVLQEQPSRSVCEALSISEGALNVRLHRARRRICGAQDAVSVARGPVPAPRTPAVTRRRGRAERLPPFPVSLLRRTS